MDSEENEDHEYFANVFSAGQTFPGSGKDQWPVASFILHPHPQSPRHTVSHRQQVWSGDMDNAKDQINQFARNVQSWVTSSATKMLKI